MDSKVCTHCYIEKPLSEFYKSKKPHDGLMRQCKECNNRRAMDYHIAHRKERLQKMAAYAETNKENIRRYQSNWYQENCQRLIEKQQHYRRNNPVKVAETNRQYRKNHRSAYNKTHAATEAARRARKKGNKQDLSSSQRQEVIERAKYRCQYCGKKCRPNELTIDHITPISKGGGDTLHNIGVACSSCNSRKHTASPLSPIQPLLLTMAAPKRKG